MLLDASCSAATASAGQAARGYSGENGRVPGGCEERLSLRKRT